MQMKSSLTGIMTRPPKGALFKGIFWSYWICDAFIFSSKLIMLSVDIYSSEWLLNTVAVRVSLLHYMLFGYCFKIYFYPYYVFPLSKTIKYWQIVIRELNLSLQGIWALTSKLNTCIKLTPSLHSHWGKFLGKFSQLLIVFFFHPCNRFLFLWLNTRCVNLQFTRLSYKKFAFKLYINLINVWYGKRLRTKLFSYEVGFTLKYYITDKETLYYKEIKWLVQGQPASK